MNLSVFLSELKVAGITVSSDGEKLNIKSSISPIPQDLLAQLKTNKQALLDFFNKLKKDEQKAANTLSPADKRRGVAISPLQQALWPIYQLQQATAYNIPLTLELQGQLDCRRLGEVLHGLYRKYDVLHGRFNQEDGKILFCSAYDPNWEMEILKVASTDVESWIEREKSRIFDLQQHSLFIARLLQTGEENFVLQLNFPHIIIDGWSISQLWQELVDVYQGQQPQESSFDFIDYLAGEKQQDHNPYWLERLKHYEPVNLHSIDPSNPEQHHVWSRQLEVQESHHLRELARQQGVSTYCAAFSTFAHVIGQFLGRKDLVISTPFSARNNSTLHNMLGYLVAMIPVRCALGDNDVAANLPQFQSQLHKDMAAAQVDLNHILPELGLTTESGRHPLQQLVFAWQDGLLDMASPQGISLNRRESQMTSAKFPLMLSMFESNGRFTMKWEFDPCLLSQSTIALLQQRFSDLLAAKGDISGITRDYPAAVAWPTEDLVSRLQAQVSLSPDQPALSGPGQSLTYRQLWQASDSVAAGLQAYGIKSGERVALHLPHGTDLAVAIIGIIKAGGVYVPLPDDLSPERMAAIITQTGMRYCLKPQSGNWLGLECLSKELYQADKQAVMTPVQLNPGHAAYINFSSGTTGEPKGIECLHQGVLRLVDNPDYVPLNPDTRMLCAAPATFDAFTLELWGPLLNGGQVCFMDQPRLDTRELTRMITKHRINTAWMTAALFHTLVDIELAAFNGLRYLLVGGDLVSPAHIHRLYRGINNIQVINGYGPTENTTFTCCFPIPLDWPAERALPVGYPISGTQVYILDADNRLQPHGCAGEIVAAGAGLAKGYLQAEQNLDRFIEVEVRDQPVRMYKTGDLGFIDAHGVVHFMGRSDKQVKINGFRVEPEAVSLCLGRETDVVRAETLAIGQGSSQQLVSFVQLSKDKPWQPERLKQALNKHLPAYMQPGLILELDKMPITVNGKLDSAALTAKFQAYMAKSQQLNRELSATEQAIADAWQDALGCGSCNASDNFYRLGGNSLLLLQAQAKLEQKLNRQISLETLIRHTDLTDLARALEQNPDSESSITPEHAPLPEVMALTTEQSRIWLLQQMNQDSAYNIPLFFHLPSGLSFTQIQEATTRLLLAHPILRMRFFKCDGIPQQTPAGIDVFPLLTESLTHAQLEQRLEQESTRRFDLAKNACFISLLQIDDGRQILVFNIHHICFDGESLAVLITALEQALQGRQLPLNQGFERFVQWHQGTEYQLKAKQDLDYWLTRLSQVTEATCLPSDLAASNSGAAAETRFAVNSAHFNQASAICQKLAISQYSYWFAVFTLVLGRLNDNRDVVVATPVANRIRPEHRQCIGFFANTLMLRQEWDESYSFADLLRLTHDNVSQGMCHQNAPLDEVLRQRLELGGQGKLALSDVLFSLLSPLRGETQAQIKVTGGKNAQAKYDFSLTIVADPVNPQFKVEYKSAKYSPELINSFIETMSVVLDQLGADIDMPLSQLQLCLAHEEAVVNAAPTPLLPATLRQQAELAPQASALAFAGQELNYQQLLEQARHLAAKLQANQVKPGDRVAVLMNRSLELPVTLLAIMLTGAAYVPLDPAYPSGRTRYVLEDAQPSLLLHDGKSNIAAVADQCPQLNIVDCINEKSSSPFIEPDISAEDLAYIIYTSGSTGQPKGVAIEHGAVAALLHWANKEYAREDFALVYAGTSVCFDLSVFEIFITWGMGGSLYFAPNTLALAQDAKHLPVTLINTVPSVLAEVLNRSQIPESVRVINLAGEALPPALVKTIAENTLSPKLYNLYGPSEDTTYSTYYQIDLNAPEQVLIGAPIDGTRGICVDSKGRAMPDHFAGELYLSGVGLAREYWCKQALTDEKFVVLDDGSRAFKTGDHVRKQSDGQYAYIGRLDNQVKLNGLRIEPGEIDDIIAQDPGVDAVCTLVHGEAAEARLVAFVTCSQQPLDKPALFAYLEEMLPYYMVPSSIQILDKMPLTPSGKQDQRALAALEIELEPTDKNAPQVLNATQADIAEIWQSLLDCGTCTSAAHFYRLGGNSLQLLTLGEKLEKHFQVSLPLDLLIRNATIAQQAKAIEQLIASGQHQAEHENKTQAQFAGLSAQQYRLWFKHHLQPTSAYNMPLYCDIPPAIDAASLSRALVTVMMRNRVLTTRIRAVESEPEVSFASLRTWQLPQQQLPESQLQQYLEQEAARQFDLSVGVCHFELLTTDGGRQILLFNIHHVAFDGFSLPIFFNELSLALKGVSTPEPVPYAAYSQWQAGREYLTQADETMNYWQQQLAGFEGCTALTGDLPGGQAQANSQYYTHPLAPQLSNSLKTLAKKCGVSEYSCWLALFIYTYSRVSQDKDVVVSMPAANRGKSSFLKTIGFFANLLPLRSQIDEQQSFTEYVIAVQALVDQGMSFQNLDIAELAERHGFQETSDIPFSKLAFSVNERMSLTLADEVTKLHSIALPHLKTEFHFFVALGQESVEWSINYDGNRFSPELIRSFTETMEVLLKQVLSQSKSRLENLSITALADKSTTARPDIRLHPLALMEKLVKEQPNNKALINKDKALDYHLLWQASAKISAGMKASGVNKGDRVAVLMSRSLDLPLTLLAAWRVGAIFIPLDPQYPQERINYIVSDAQPKLVIYDDESVDNIAQAALNSAISFNTLINTPLSGGAPEHTPALDDPAYMIYTSGSTGKPKGVLLNFTGLSQLHLWAKDTYHTDDYSFVFTSASVCFDASVLDIFITWGLGGCVYFAETPMELLDVSEHREISMVGMVPSVFAQLMTHADIQNRIRVLNLGGEVLPVSLAKKIMTSNPDLRLYNLYGPTENTIVSTFHQVDLARNERILIGQPVTGTEMMVMDASGRPLPPYFSGELYLTGDSLAVEYWNNPAMTSEKFIRTGPQAKRVYKTGDKVRRLADGQYEYLGRLDEQVKIRGLRIEIGEVEQVLSQHAAVLESCVVIHQGKNGETSLVAFYTTAEHKEVQQDIRRWMQAYLPPYMVPSFYTHLDQLPLNPAGKLDRGQLAKRELPVNRQSLEDKTSSHNFRLFLEQNLNGRELDMGLSPHDNGLSSLMIMSLTRKLNDHYKADLKFTDLYEIDSFQELALQLDISPTATQQLSASFAAQFERLCQQFQIPAAQAAVIEKNSVSLASFGVSEQAGHFSPHKKGYRIGCASKVLTSLLCLRLCEQKHFTLDSQVIDLIDTGTSEQRLQGIKIQHLLSHSHGLDVSVNFNHFQPQDPLAIAVTRLLPRATSIFPPGTMYGYSMFGHMLLAYICETVTKKPFMDLCHEYIFKPLDITLSCAEDGENPASVCPKKHMISGSTLTGDRYQALTDYASVQASAVLPSGTAAAYMSAADLARVGQSYLTLNRGGTGLLSDDTISQVFRARQKVENHPVYKEVGITFLKLENGLWGHLGDSEGQQMSIQIDPDAGKVLVVNAAANPSIPLIWAVVDEQFQTPAYPKSQEKPFRLCELPGQYSNASLTINVVQKQGKYQLSPHSLPGSFSGKAKNNYPLRALPGSEHLFELTEPDSLLRGNITFFGNSEGDFLRVGQNLFKKVSSHQ
ncbi:non-ribosomal peptide synthetase [Thalassomonas haliotis]|uniref:Amino acid adenylation domain-containing protein n=1 Tax=Thalassomonas haliotis TaxID=485448 RepID=A0ABY7VE40_9GAMM|nr:non-ribosomal peptide synthetase [Thalassomonas haliotis]WDE11818.1 amino acid adenylation domain-containing protein [Thalassomonas haliotis]